MPGRASSTLKPNRRSLEAANTRVTAIVMHARTWATESARRRAELPLPTPGGGRAQPPLDGLPLPIFSGERRASPASLPLLLLLSRESLTTGRHHQLFSKPPKR